MRLMWYVAKWSRGGGYQQNRDVKDHRGHHGRPGLGDNNNSPDGGNTGDDSTLGDVEPSISSIDNTEGNLGGTITSPLNDGHPSPTPSSNPLPPPLTPAPDIVPGLVPSTIVTPPTISTPVRALAPSTSLTLTPTDLTLTLPTATSRPSESISTIKAALILPTPPSSSTYPSTTSVAFATDVPVDSSIEILPSVTSSNSTLAKPKSKAGIIGIAIALTLCLLCILGFLFRWWRRVRRRNRMAPSAQYLAAHGTRPISWAPRFFNRRETSQYLDTPNSKSLWGSNNSQSGRGHEREDQTQSGTEPDMRENHGGLANGQFKTPTGAAERIDDLFVAI